MKTEHEILIFVYFLCIIVITIILFSFIFNAITTRLFGNYPIKTKIYYLEIFSIWLILVYIMLNIKININRFSKKNLTHYVSSNGELGNYTDIYSQIDQIEKFDMLIIIGFVVIFLNYHHNPKNIYKDKLSSLNEDIGIIGAVFE